MMMTKTMIMMKMETPSLRVQPTSKKQTPHLEESHQPTERKVSLQSLKLSEKGRVPKKVVCLTRAKLHGKHKISKQDTNVERFKPRWTQSSREEVLSMEPRE